MSTKLIIEPTGYAGHVKTHKDFIIESTKYRINKYGVIYLWKEYCMDNGKNISVVKEIKYV